VNINGSVAPTVQTTKTNKSTSIIPSSKYGGLLDPSQTVASKGNSVPWTISVHNKSFMEAVMGKPKGNQESDNESDTFRSGNSGRKTVRETELEEENKKLIQQLKEQEEVNQQMYKQIQEYKKERKEDKEELNQVKQNLKYIEEKGRDRDAAMAEMRTLLLELKMDKTHRESDKRNREQGSTPKRKKRITNEPMENQKQNPITGATLEEEFPEESLLLEGSVADDEPITLEEGREIT
jgi:predicted RNase H-like nuclease (RuvC/YqgF family)